MWFILHRPHRRRSDVAIQRKDHALHAAFGAFACGVSMNNSKRRAPAIGKPPLTSMHAIAASDRKGAE